MATYPVLASIMVGMVATFLTGCVHTDPPTCRLPQPEGCDRRVPQEATTDAEKRDLPTLPSLCKASEEIAQALAGDINRIIEEKFNGHRITLILGDITNKTQIVPTSDFQMVQHRITANLLHSKRFRDNVKIIENQKRMNALTRELQDNGPESPSGMAASQPISGESPEYTTYLLVDAFSKNCGSVLEYYIEVKLIRASDKAQLFLKSYEVK